MVFLKDILGHVLNCIYGIRRVDGLSSLPEIPKLNGSVYEFYKPPDNGTPEIEVIFLHGIQQHSDSPTAHLTTWTSISSDGSRQFYWPLELLAREFPRARLLSVLYDSRTTKGSTHGVLDLYRIAENLTYDLTSIHSSGCPLVLVGQDVGGLVTKAVCVRADQQSSRGKGRAAECQSFLSDVKRILYYCTPHLGFHRLPRGADGVFAKTLGPLDVETVRLNEEFRDLCTSARCKGWRTTQLATPSTESAFGLSEGTLRNGYVDVYYTDHRHNLHSVSRPHSQTDPAYDHLRILIQEAIAERQAQCKSLRSGSYKSIMLFERDEKYVPMERTMTDVLRALQNADVKGVILHGDTGTGKSSLSRHIAVHVEESQAAITGLPCNDVLCYVNCGFEASISDTQDQLLSYFNLDFNVDPRHDSKDSDVSDKRSIRAKRRIIAEHLRDLRGILILDDVHDSDLLENVLVPGKGLKYLVIARNADLWPDAGWQRIRIQPLSLPSALQVLANYAQLKDGRIPQEFETQAREIIEEVQYHPLAVATLGAVLQRKDKFSADTWNGVKDYLMTYLDEGRLKIINSGTSYPMSVSKAMTLILDSKYLGSSAMNVMYILNLFQGPIISESVVKSFLTDFQPKALKDFDPSIEALEALSLVQFMKLPVFNPRFLIAGIDEELLEVESEIFEDVTYERFFYIHDLRQQFFLQMTEELNVLASSLKSRRSHDWSTLLIATFGVKKNSEIRKEALRRLGFRRYSTSILKNILLFSLSSFPVNNQRRKPSGEQQRLHITCNEVLHALLLDDAVDDEKMISLLEEQQFIEWISTVLTRIFCDPQPTRAGPSELFRSSTFPDKLLDVLAQSEEPVIHILFFLWYIMLFYPEEKLDRWLSTEKLLRILIRRDYLSVHKGLISAISTQLINFSLSQTSSNAAKAFNIPGWMNSLIGWLSEVACSEQHFTPGLQAKVRISALCALIHMMDHEGNNILTDPATDSHALLRTTEVIMSHNAAEEYVHFYLTRILACTLHQKVMTILSQGEGEICKNSFQLIRSSNQAADFAEAIVHSDLEKLVHLLLRKGLQSDFKIKVVQGLGMAGDALPSLAGSILMVPGCLEKLLGLLAVDIKKDLRMEALETLCQLSRVAETASSEEYAFIVRKLLETEAFFARVATYISGDGRKCGKAILSLHLVIHKCHNSEILTKLFRCIIL